jgi:hypothetical protein
MELELEADLGLEAAAESELARIVCVERGDAAAAGKTRGVVAARVARKCDEPIATREWPGVAGSAVARSGASGR